MKTTKQYQTKTSKMGKAIVFAAIVATLTAAQALTSAGPKRPATVPADYVITPFGYFHPSCVNHLAKGDVLRQDQEAIQRANGTLEKIQECAYPHYKPDGEVVTGDERDFNPPFIGHSWVESVSATTTTAYGALAASWIVPPAPLDNDGQTLFFFPGLVDNNDVVTILQPVLGWNADFDSAWGIASWNCCVNGQLNESTPLPVSSGDQITGTITNLCQAPHTNEHCQSWEVITTDITSSILEGTPNDTQLLGTSSYGQTFNWAFGGALEVYNVAQCGDYPSSTRLSFFGLYLYNYKFVQIDDPKWSNNVTSGLTPQCSYGGGPRTQITLDFAN
jgi:hypothetical protein